MSEYVRPTRREDLPVVPTRTGQATRTDWDRWTVLHRAAHKRPTP